MESEEFSDESSQAHLSDFFEYVSSENQHMEISLPNSEMSQLSSLQSDLSYFLC